MFAGIGRFRHTVGHFIVKHPLTLIAICLWLLAAGSLNLFVVDQFSTPLQKQKFSIPNKVVKECSLVQYDTTPEKKPVFSMQFNTLRQAPFKSEIFKTNLCSSISVEGLQIRVYEYTARKNENAKSVGSNRAKKQVVQNRNPLVLTQAQDLQLLSDFLRAYKIDVKSVADVKSRAFKYELRHDNRVVLEIESALAEFDASTNSIKLHGFVTVTSGTKTVECRNVFWNPRENSFSIKGKYVLKSKKERFLGVDDIYDVQLNRIDQENS